ncbi:twin-arginine translocase subunit TatC [Paenibacillus sp. An7]|uniref:twin-arginine translocase subunit TatC n=1 Tax=Paenibacillus sp. An7 TaxID=2689577 RepID=UPI00135926AC|nr:twin-arginine translocase subunit TatC [Paenibacillus sp. An7]
MSEQEEGMTLVNHLGELRRRLVAVLVVLLLGLIGGLFISDPIYQYLITYGPLPGIELHALTLWDGLGMYMKIALIFSLVITLPFTAYQIWKFVSPGLTPSEQKATVRYIPFVLLLFLLGIAFSYKILLPMATSFTSSINQNLGLVETYGMAQYFTFMFNLILPVSLLFELPVVVMFLTKLRILNPLRLRKMRRISYFALVFIAVFVTPPDFISDILVTIPLILLYEFSVFLSSVVYRKQLEETEEYESRYVKVDAGEKI